jgi:hypothetical protein
MPEAETLVLTHAANDKMAVRPSAPIILTDTGILWRSGVFY